MNQTKTHILNGSQQGQDNHQDQSDKAGKHIDQSALLSKRMSKKRLIHRLFALALLASPALINSPALADLTAQVTPAVMQQLAVNDTFDLTLTSTKLTQQMPDLAPLEQDFRILGISQTMQTKSINGRRSGQQRWVVSLSPKQVGQLTIPAIYLGNDRTMPIPINVVNNTQQNTNPVGINNPQNGYQAQQPPVTPTSPHQGASTPSLYNLSTSTVTLGDNERIQVTATVPNNEHYVFAQIPLTVRIETAQQVSQAELILEDIANVEVEQQGQDRISQIMKNGRAITILERQYLLSPQYIGTFEIPPVIVQGYFEPSSNSGGMTNSNSMDDYINQQIRQHLGGQFTVHLGGGGEAFTVRSQPLTVNVLPNPSGQNDWFLPATDVRLSSRWQADNPVFNAGDAVTQVIELTARGAMPEQLPDIELPHVDDLQMYVDSNTTTQGRDSQGKFARRTIILSVIPEFGGDYTLPELTIDWYNTQTKRAQTAVLPSQIIHVNGEANPANRSNPADSALPASSDTDMDALASAVDSTDAEDSDSIWTSSTIVGLLIGLLGLLGLVGYVYRRQAIKRRELLEEASFDAIDYNNRAYHTNRATSAIESTQAVAKRKLAESLALIQQNQKDGHHNDGVRKTYQAITAYKYEMQDILNNHELSQITTLQNELEAILYTNNANDHRDTKPSIDSLITKTKALIASRDKRLTSKNKETALDLPDLYPS